MQSAYSITQANWARIEMGEKGKDRKERLIEKVDKGKRKRYEGARTFNQKE